MVFSKFQRTIHIGGRLTFIANRSPLLVEVDFAPSRDIVGHFVTHSLLPQDPRETHGDSVREAEDSEIVSEGAFGARGDGVCDSEVDCVEIAGLAQACFGRRIPRGIDVGNWVHRTRILVVEDHGSKCRGASKREEDDEGLEGVHGQSR